MVDNKVKLNGYELSNYISMLKTLALILFIVSWVPLKAQMYREVIYNYETGLPNNMTKDIIQDERGFVWIASDVGVIRYDGKDFKLLDEDLQSSYVKDLYRSEGNRLYIITDLGISYIDLKRASNDSVTQFLAGARRTAESMLFYPKTIYIDQKKRFWISQPSDIIQVINKDSLKRYTFPDRYATNTYLHSFKFFEDVHNRLFVMAQQPVFLRYKPRDDRFEPVPIDGLEKVQNINDLLYDRESNMLWLGCSNGLYRINMDGGLENLEVKKQLDLNNIQAIQLGVFEDFLIGTAGQGLFNYRNGRLQKIDQIPFKVINRINLINKSQIWISSDEGAALLYSGLFKHVLQFTNFSVQILSKSMQDEIYATDGRQIFEINENQTVFRASLLFENEAEMVSAIAGNNQTVYTGHIDGMISVYRKGMIKQIEFENQFTVFNLFLDSRENLWICRDGTSRLIRLSEEGQKRFYGAEDGLNHQINALRELEDGRLVAAGKNVSNAIYVFDYQTDHFRNVLTNQPLTSNEPVEAFDLAIDNKGKIWLATDDGVYRYDFKNLKKYSKGKIENVKSIAVDASGNKWFGTDNGLYCYKDDELLRYTKQNGFNNLTFAFRSIQFDHQDRIWAGTYDGIYSMDPETIKWKFTNRPKIINVETGKPASTRQRDQQMILRSGSFLNFTVAPLAYPSSDILYQFRLLSSQNDWSRPTKKKSYLLKSLQEGRHELQVRAQKPGNLWSGNYILPFTVKNAWYKSWWSYVIYISIIIMVVILLIIVQHTSREKIKIEEELFNSEEKIRTVADNVPIILFAFDVHKRITFITGKGLKAVGSEPDKFIGTKVDDFLESLIHLRNGIDRVLEGKSASVIQKIQNLYFQFWGTPTYNKKGQVNGGLGVGYNITEIKKAERESQKARASAEAASKAKTQFLANMSHEIRTPMNAIIGLTDVVLNTQLNDEQREFLNSVKLSANELLRLLNALLDFSRIENRNLQIDFMKMNVVDVVSETAKAWKANAKLKHNTIEYHIEKNIPALVMGDPTRLRQVLLNLIGNAVKFTEKGHISVNVRIADRSVKKVFLEFSVKDNGIGIPEDKQQMIFEPFAQVDASSTRKFGGTGLGLSITAELIKLMGGSIKVDSKEGQGSIFTFVLPFSQLSVKKISQKAAQTTVTDKNDQDQIEEEKANKPIQILLVEDNPINQKLISRMLGENKYTVTHANKGWEAIDTALQNDFDIILMDIQMPEGDGFKAIERIRINDKDKARYTPIIALSARFGEEEWKNGMAIGIDAFLNKPVEREALFQILKRYV
ncbi:MAG: response regulator [Caldithrix sp.]|nr:response regulator [Caldithrix sp.]